MSVSAPAVGLSFVIAVLLTACGFSAGETRARMRFPAIAKMVDSYVATETPQAFDFTEELAMGADCSSGAITDSPLEDMACSGKLPERVASFIRSIPGQHPLLSESERERLSRSRQSFKLVKGMGQRHDILTVLDSDSPFWIRSFEGPDPDITVYLVYGPECEASTLKSTVHERQCRPAGTYLRKFTLYRVQKGEVPQDVTSEISLPPPRLNAQERGRYGTYVRSSGDAADSDVHMDVSRLVYVPVVRWVLRPVQESEYQPPDMPASDPRAFEDYYWGSRNVAHFGFLVWNGRRMELRETISPALWPCRIAGPVSSACDAGYDSRSDRYLIPMSAQRPGGPNDESSSGQ